MSDCIACSGKVIKAEYNYGGRNHTMMQMLGWMFGIGDEEEKEKVEDGIQIVRGNLLTFDNSSREYAPLGVEINYCPMCGKKLEAIKEEVNTYDS